MDTKLISSAKSWWGDYRIWIRNIENIFIIIFLMITPTLINILFGGVSFQNIVKLNYSANQSIVSRVNYRDVLVNPDKYKESRLLQKSIDMSNQMYEITNYLKDIENVKTKEEREKIILKFQELANYYAGVVIVNKDNGYYYSNRSWFYEPPYSLSTPKEIIEGLSKTDNWVYITLNPTDNLEEIYFSKSEFYNEEIYSIRISFILSLITTILLILLLLKKLIMFKRMGIRTYLKTLKEGYLYKWFLSIRILFNRNIIIEEVLKDKVLLFVLFVAFIYLVFFYLINKINIVLGYVEYFNPYYLYFIIGIFLITHFVLKFVRKYDALELILEDLNKIKQGDMELEVKYNEDKQIRMLAKEINTLRIGYKDSIEEGIKNEKLKTELISNVSHDLKTPLTSIINYVNILQRNDITDLEKREYVKILESKSNRLKKLIDDLFEVSKMNSGKVELFMMNIDIVQLIYQCLSEVEDIYSDKNIEFKVKAPQELMIVLDPQRISRVIQNLATNSLKYGLENTRVYVEIKDKKDKIEISFKNISAFELDFDEEDILERFARGDKSRASTIEGSGLGLAIATSIIELHNGNFRVECEGDLFKAFVIIPKI